MTFAVLTNIATMILCIAVLVQAVRLMRALDTVKGGALTDVVEALDAATGEARRVLGRLTDLMRGDVAATARTLSEGKAMIEELAIMTGIANAIAERIVEAAGASRGADTAPEPADDFPPAPSPPVAAAIVAAPAADPPAAVTVKSRRRARQPARAASVAAA